VLGPRIVEVERIGVLHQEFAAAHQPEARAHLVAEFPLDVIEVEGQILIGAHVGAENLRDHLLVGGAVEHVALVAVLDAQHLLAIGLVTAAFAPQVGGLERRHQEFDGAGAVLLLADDGADLIEDAQPERQEGIDACGLLADHAGAQHQPMGNDVGFLRRLAQNRQEKTGQTHCETFRFDGFVNSEASETGSGGKTQGSPLHSRLIRGFGRVLCRSLGSAGANRADQRSAPSGRIAGQPRRRSDPIDYFAATHDC